jgi:hypothetical protein
MCTSSPKLGTLLEKVQYNFSKITNNDYFAQIPQGTEEHERLRDCFKLGSSQFGPAMGVSSLLSRNKLHLQHHGKSAPTPHAVRIMQSGKDKEPLCFDLLKPIFKRSGLELENTGTWMFTNHGDTGLDYCCTPDGLLYERKKSGDRELVATLEIKSPFYDVLYLDLVKSVVTLKPDHYIQVQAQIDVTACKKGYYACYTSDKTLLVCVPYAPGFMDWVFKTIAPFCEECLCPAKWRLAAEFGKPVGKIRTLAGCEGWGSCRSPPRMANGAAKALKEMIDYYQAKYPPVLVYDTSQDKPIEIK